MSDHRYIHPAATRANMLGYRKLATTAILAVALVGFETFNYSTTAFALGDLLGDLSFLGLRWSTTLAIAFCAIDFAGIARLFLPESDNEALKELWYLFGAWLLAATMNAVLTWWGISMAMVNRPLSSTAIIDPQILTQNIPVFIAILVWVTRILLIGSFSITVKPDVSQEASRRGTQNGRAVQPAAQQPLIVRRKERIPSPKSEPVLARNRPSESLRERQEEEDEERPEPVYIPMDTAFHSLSASSQNRNPQSKRF